MKWLAYLTVALFSLGSAAPTTEAELALGANYGTPRMMTITPGPSRVAAGARLLAAVDAIDDADAAHPYVIVLEPGEYELIENTLIMKEWVSIRGKDRPSTRISGMNTDYLVRSASNTDISHISLEHYGVGSRARTLSNIGVTNLRIEDVDVYASNAYSFVDGIENQAASPTIRNVRVAVSGTGAASVNGIVNKEGASPTIWDTEIYVSVPSAGRGTGIESSWGCFPDIYDTYVGVTVEGSGWAQGLYFINDCRATVQRVRVNISGGDDIIGIFNSNSSFLTLRDILVIVNGKGTASEAYGIKCIGDATLDMDRGHVSVSGATKVVGVEGSQSLDAIEMSLRRGSVNSQGDCIKSNVGLKIYAASMLLKGTIDDRPIGDIRCIHCLDYDTYAPLDSDCQPAD